MIIILNYALIFIFPYILLVVFESNLLIILDFIIQFILDKNTVAYGDDLFIAGYGGWWRNYPTGKTVGDKNAWETMQEEEEYGERDWTPAELIYWVNRIGDRLDEIIPPPEHWPKRPPVTINDYHPDTVPTWRVQAQYDKQAAFIKWHKEVFADAFRNKHKYKIAGYKYKGMHLHVWLPTNQKDLYYSLEDPSIIFKNHGWIFRMDPSFWDHPYLGWILCVKRFLWPDMDKGILLHPDTSVEGFTALARQDYLNSTVYKWGKWGRVYTEWEVIEPYIWYILPVTILLLLVIYFTLEYWLMPHKREKAAKKKGKTSLGLSGMEVVIITTEEEGEEEEIYDAREALSSMFPISNDPRKKK